MSAASKKEKPLPKKCICGNGGVIVKCCARTMVSCPNPIRCDGNFRTQWNRSEEAAIAEWNNLIDSYRFSKATK